MSRWASVSGVSYSSDGGPLVVARSRRPGSHLRADKARQPGSGQTGSQTIYEGCAQLKNFPNIGRASRRTNGRRELTFASLPYIAVHQIKEHAVEISRIFHASQDWP